MGDLIIVESWQKYVEGKNQEQEELKSGLARVKKWLPYKSKKASPNHKYQSQFQQQPPQQDTAATAAYAQYGQPGYFPYYMMPSNPQGYSFAYGVYMRPPQH